MKSFDSFGRSFVDAIVLHLCVYINCQRNHTESCGTQNMMDLGPNFFLLQIHKHGTMKSSIFALSTCMKIYFALSPILVNLILLSRPSFPKGLLFLSFTALPPFASKMLLRTHYCHSYFHMWSYFLPPKLEIHFHYRYDAGIIRWQESHKN